MQRNLSFLSRLLIIFLISCMLTPSAHSHLPDLGSEYRSTLSVHDEKLLGDTWMRQIRGSNSVYQDPLVNDYVQYIGNKLTPHATMPYQDIKLKFFAVNDPSVNAFAFFGGHVAVHSGLILMTETESELAGVMAHELAHISQQHILRQMTESKRLQPIAMAGTIAAVLLGIPPMLAGAGYMQHMLNFSREHEQEADRIGIKILAQAKFDPQGLPSIFERMNLSTRYNNKPPEYLLTHPLFESRISDSRHRASMFAYKQNSSSNMFYLIRARLEVQGQSNLQQVLYDYEHKLQTKRHPHELSIQYAYSYALLKAGKSSAAWKALTPLLKDYPEDLIIQMTAAEIEQAESNYTAAQIRLEKLVNIYPDSSALSLNYTELLLKLRQPKRAQQVLTEYRKVHTLEPIYYELHRHAEGMLGNKIAVLEANAEWYFLNADFPSALQQLEIAMDSKEIDQKSKGRIKARLDELEKLYKETKKLE